jgi:hypothetical protein
MKKSFEKVWIFVQKDHGIKHGGLDESFHGFTRLTFILQLIREISNFKSLITNYLRNDHETLVGHMNMHFLIFLLSYLND